MVEHPTVNRRVTGSSPVAGAFLFLGFVDIVPKVLQIYEIFIIFDLDRLVGNVMMVIACQWRHAREML